MWIDVFALKRDGDEIAIDVNAQTVDLNVPDAELTTRRAQLALVAPQQDEGWLSVYAHSVRPLSRGGSGSAARRATWRQS